MARKKKFTREIIINSCVELIRNEGFDALTIRKIAKKMNSSINPIFYEFGTLDNLKKAAILKCIEIYNTFINKVPKIDSKPYLSFGISFLRFAYLEPNIFNVLYLSNETDKLIIKFHQQENSKAIEKIKLVTSFDLENSAIIHKNLSIAVLGLGVLLSQRKIIYNEKEITKFLIDLFDGQALLMKEGKYEHN